MTGTPVLDLPTGVAVKGAVQPRFDEVLSHDALAFVAELHRRFNETRKRLLALRAEQALGHHWGTFQLTDEGIERPPEALKTALAAAGLAEERFRPMRPGLSWTA